MTQDSWKPLINSLPKGLSFSEAAAHLGRDYQAVRQAIRRHRYKAIDGRRFSQSGRRKFLYDDVDWTQSNVAISREHGVSRELVRRIRKRLGHPMVEARGRKRKTCDCDPNQHQCCDVCTGWNKKTIHKDKK